jgi:hypothetical protein
MNYKKIRKPDDWFILIYPDNPDAVPGLKRRPLWPWRYGMESTQNYDAFWFGPIVFRWNWRPDD